MLMPTKGVNHENVEQGVNAFKNFIFDQPMSICYWHKYRMFEILVELYLNATIVNQRILMRLECAIENIICQGGAAPRGLVGVGWDFEG
jgi:hypothetical protein